MNKLLVFFIPKVTKEILKFFGFSLVIAVMIQLLPVETDPKDSFIKLILYLAFPMISYFNRMMYLPASLEWILLTPIKKLHIILVHGLINIYKILFIFSLIMLFLFFYDKVSFIDFWTSEDDWRVIYNGIHVGDITSFVILFILATSFVFGILPNLVQTLQQQQSYKVKRTLKENVKWYLTILGVFVFLGALYAGYNQVDPYLPWFIKSSAIFMMGFCAAIDCTLTSLRYYYSKEKLYSCGAVLVALYSCFLYFYVQSDIHSKNIHVSDKIRSLEYVGIYSKGLDVVVEDELLASGPSLAQLVYTDLKPYLQRNAKNDTNRRLLKRWETICQEKKDFTCRLAYYVYSFMTDNKTPLDLVRKSCPNDLRSCYIIHDNKDIPLEEQKFASEIMIKKCKKNTNEFEHYTCMNYENHVKKKEERRAKNPTIQDSQNTSLSPKTSSPPAPRPSLGGRK